MRKVRMVNGGATIMAILLCSFLTGLPAEAKTVDVKDARYNVNFSMVDNLKGFTGKKVSVYLDSGKTLVGYVKDVSSHFVHLEKLEGKEFFDALIRIEDIGAIDARFREFKR